jgi:hypothetical protein
VTVERWAQQIIEKELNCPVVVHDDGSQPSMYDLRIGAVEAPDVAIECVGAVDPVRTETWKVGPGKGHLRLRVKGDWIIGIAPEARIRTIRRHIESILRDLEERDVHRVRVGHFLKSHDYQLLQHIESLGIRHAYCFSMPGSGRVFMTIEGVGGWVESAGSALPQWIEEFLCDPERKDVLFKLRHTGAQERWAFVPVESGGAPWPIESYLTGEFECLRQDRTCRLLLQEYGSFLDSVHTVSVGTALDGACLGLEKSRVRAQHQRMTSVTTGMLP